MKHCLFSLDLTYYIITLPISRTKRNNKTSTMSSSSPHVFFARGHGVEKNQGNKRYRQLIHLNHEAYKAARDRKSQTSIAKIVISNIQSTGAKFLSRAEGHEASAWTEVSSQTLMRKVKQALRDCKQLSPKTHQHPTTSTTEDDMEEELSQDERETISDEQNDSDDSMSNNVQSGEEPNDEKHYASIDMEEIKSLCVAAVAATTISQPSTMDTQDPQDSKLVASEFAGMNSIETFHVSSDFNASGGFRGKSFFLESKGMMDTSDDVRGSY